MQLHHFFIDFSKLDSFSIWMDLKKNDAGSRLSHSLSLALGERTHPIYRYRRLKTFFGKMYIKNRSLYPIISRGSTYSKT